MFALKKQTHLVQKQMRFILTLPVAGAVPLAISSSFISNCLLRCLIVSCFDWRILLMILTSAQRLVNLLNVAITISLQLFMQLPCYVYSSSLSGRMCFNVGLGVTVVWKQNASCVVK